MYYNKFVILCIFISSFFSQKMIMIQVIFRFGWFDTLYFNCKNRYSYKIFYIMYIYNCFECNRSIFE